MGSMAQVFDSVAGTPARQPQAKPGAQGGNMAGVFDAVEKNPDFAFSGPKPADNSAVAQQMVSEGVMDYQPHQGLPYGHFGPSAMRSSDITPTQAGAGLGAIGAASGAAVLPEIAAVAGHLGNLQKIVQLARAAGWGSITFREAHDLYKMFTSESK